jgi:hypothetical protein
VLNSDRIYNLKNHKFFNARINIFNSKKKCNLYLFLKIFDYKNIFNYLFYTFKENINEKFHLYYINQRFCFVVLITIIIDLKFII